MHLSGRMLSPGPERSLISALCGLRPVLYGPYNTVYWSSQHDLVRALLLWARSSGTNNNGRPPVLFQVIEVDFECHYP